MSTQNPDFTLASKKAIAEATRRVLNAPADNNNVERPKQPPAQRNGLPAAQYDGMGLQVTSQLTWGAGFMRLVNAPPT